MGTRRGSKGSRRGVGRSGPSAAQKRATALARQRQTLTVASTNRVKASKAAAVNATILDLRSAQTTLRSNITKLNAVSNVGRSASEALQLSIARQETASIEADISRQLQLKSKAAARSAAIARQRAKADKIRAAAARKAAAVRAAAEKAAAEKRAALLARPVNHTASNKLLALADSREAGLAQQAKFANDQRRTLLANVNKDIIAGKLDKGQARRRVNSINQAHARRTDPRQLANARSSIANLRKQAAKEKAFELNRNKLQAAEEDRVAKALAQFQTNRVTQGSVSRAGKSLRASLRNKQKSVGLTGSPANAFARQVDANNTRIALARVTFTAQKRFDVAFEARRQTAVRNSKANAVSAAIKEREQRATGQLVGTSTRVAAAPKAAGQNFSINLRETLSLGDSLVTKFTPAPKVKAVTQQVSVAPSAAAAGRIEVTRASGKKAVLTPETAKTFAERGQLSPESTATILAPPIIPDIQDVIGPTKPKGKKPSQFTTTAPSTIQNAITKESKPFIQEAFAEEGGSLIDAETKKELEKNPQNLIPNVVQLDKNKVKVVGGFKAGDEVTEVQIPTLSGATFSAVAPTGRNLNDLQSNEEKKIGNALDAGLGVTVGGNFIGGETSVIFDPQAKVTTKDKPLVSPTRILKEGTAFSVKDGVVSKKPIKKSTATINAETIATRLGNAPFVTQVDLSAENLRQGSQLLDRSDFFTTDKITGEKKQITGDSLEGKVINQIGEEQDVKNVLNAIQEQRFQNIKNAQAEIDPITGQTIRTAGEVALDIARATPEPTVSFTFGAGSAFRPTGQEQEVEQLEDGSFILTKTGGFTDENLPFIQEVLESTPRASVQEGLGFGPPTIELETGKLIEKVNDDGSVEVVKETARFLDPDRFSSQFRPQVGVVSVGKPDVIAETKSGKTFILSQDVAQQLDKEGVLSSPIDNFQTGTKPELEAAGLEGIGGTFNLNQNLNATPNSPFALPDNSGQVLESSPVTEDLARSGAVDFPSFIQTASADSGGPALGLIGPVAQRPTEQVSIQKPLFDEKTLGLGEVRDKFSFGDFLENPIEGLGQFAGGATRSAQNEVAGIQNIGSLASGGQIPQREFLGTPSQQFYDAVITGAIDVGGKNFGEAAQRFGDLRQRGIGAVFEDPLGFIQSTAAVLDPIGSTLRGIALDPTVQQKFGELGQSILDNPFAAAGDISFQAATFLGPQAVLKVARVAGVIAPKAASAASLGVKLQKGQKIEAALIQSKKGAKKEVVNVLINKGQKLKRVDNGLGGSNAIVINKKTGNIIRVIETTATPVAAKTALIIDNTASVNRKIAKTVDPKEIKRLASGKQKFGNLSDLSKSEQKILDAGKTQAGAILTLDPTGTAQLLGKQGSINVFQKGGKRVLLKEKTFEIIDLKTGNKKIALRQDLAESVTEMPLGARLFDTLTGLESAVKPSSKTAQLPSRATEATEAGVLGKLDFVKSGVSKSEFEPTGVFSPTGTRIGPLPKSPTDIAAALGRQKSKELNVFEDFLSKRGGFVTRETSLGESAGAASFDPFFGRTITPTAEAAGVAGRQFIPEPFGLGTGSTTTVVKVKPKLNTGFATAKVFDTLSPAQKQAVIEESFTRAGIGTAKQSGKLADDVRATALTSAAQGKSLRGILTDIGKTTQQTTTGAKSRILERRRVELANDFVTDKGGLPFTKIETRFSSTLTGRVGKGINETLKARTKEFDVAIPTGTLGRDAQLTGEILRDPAFTKALQKVKPSVLDDSLGISPRRQVQGFGETRLSVGTEGLGFKTPQTFTKTAKSGVLKAVDDFAAPKIQRAAALGDDFLNIQRGVIGATSKTVRSVTSVGKKVGTKAKATPQKLLQKVKQPKPTGLLDDLDPSGTLKIGKLGKGSKTIGKTADDLLNVGRTIKPKRGLPVGLITGIGSQVVQQFRPSTVTGVQAGFEQVLNPFQSSKQGVQSSVALVPRQARPSAQRFQFPFAVPRTAQAQAQPFPQRQGQILQFGTPTPPARNLLVPFGFGRGGGQGDTGAGDLSARRKFFRVFDVAKTPFGRVERGLGIQVQSSAQIQEVSDVLGRAPERNVSERFFGEQGNGNGGKRRRRGTTFDDSLFSF